ncbi:hypothetical protein SUGI_0242690 [Cryptomeria japonica]|nr:hypothetical protein SUGI_0242690 [Cryptomeria japonica]
MNDAKLEGILSSLCLANSEQQPDQEVHQMETTFRGKENIPVHVSRSVTSNDCSEETIELSRTQGFLVLLLLGCLLKWSRLERAGHGATMHFLAGRRVFQLLSLEE